MDWLDLLAIQGTLRAFSNTTVQKHQLFGFQLSFIDNKCSTLHIDAKLSYTMMIPVRIPTSSVQYAFFLFHIPINT